MVVINLNGAVMKLWVKWNIRVLIIASLSLQVFLNLTAPKRKHSWVGRKWLFQSLLWLAYMSADWVAINVTGHIFGLLVSPSDDLPGDILMFWTPFLLLHLGGPDNITSYALEDNEFWKRHLFQLVIQVSLTIFIILQFSLENKLLLPAVLVLFAGITKYVERNIALYRASFDHFGEDWKIESSGIVFPIPIQLQQVKMDPLTIKTAVNLFGILKSLLVGPLIDKKEKRSIEVTFDEIKERHCDVLRVMEIELSLLYEVLHTKLPVIASRCGLHFRIANLGCIFFALISFSLAQRHYNLTEFDIFLTYALLIGAIVLDLTSIWLLIKRSDWFAICHSRDETKVINKRRWANIVSQSNLITYYAREYRGWLKTVEDFPYIGALFQAIKDFQCESSKDVGEVNGIWSFIVEEVGEFPQTSDKQLLQIQQVWLIDSGRELLREKEREALNELDFTQSLLALHIASELCFQDVNQSNPRESRDYREICKLLSDYMFHLAVTRSNMMSAVLINWKSEFKDFLFEIAEVHGESSRQSSNERDSCRRLLNHDFNEDGNWERLRPVFDLAIELKMRADDRWEVMSKIWVQFMCYAAINCRADVHARQLSQGGELLTLVWLLMNHSGLFLKSYTGLDLVKDETTKTEEKSPIASLMVKNVDSTTNVAHQHHLNIFPWSMYQ